MAKEDMDALNNLVGSDERFAPLDGATYLDGEILLRNFNDGVSEDEYFALLSEALGGIGKNVDIQRGHFLGGYYGQSDFLAIVGRHKDGVRLARSIIQERVLPATLRAVEDIGGDTAALQARFARYLDGLSDEADDIAALTATRAEADLQALLEKGRKAKAPRLEWGRTDEGWEALVPSGSQYGEDSLLISGDNGVEYTLTHNGEYVKAEIGGNTHATLGDARKAAREYAKYGLDKETWERVLEEPFRNPEHGDAIPAMRGVLARAAAGSAITGTAAASTGDTPEERLRRLLAGGLTGAVMAGGAPAILRALEPLSRVAANPRRLSSNAAAAAEVKEVARQAEMERVPNATYEAMPVPPMSVAPLIRGTEAVPDLGVGRVRVRHVGRYFSERFKQMHPGVTPG
jgi:hypothetical protein